MDRTQTSIFKSSFQQRTSSKAPIYFLIFSINFLWRFTKQVNYMGKGEIWLLFQLNDAVHFLQVFEFINFK